MFQMARELSPVATENNKKLVEFLRSSPSLTQAYSMYQKRPLVVFRYN